MVYFCNFIIVVISTMLHSLMNGLFIKASSAAMVSHAGAESTDDV